MSARKESFILSRSLQVRGEIVVQQDAVIESDFEGTLIAEGHKVIIAIDTRVQGEIRAAAVVVYGSVSGTIRAESRIEVRAGGLVDGELQAPRFILDDGSRIRGSVNQGLHSPAGVGENEDSLGADAHPMQRRSRSIQSSAHDIDRPTIPLSDG